jgi:hypothetical protein
VICVYMLAKEGAEIAHRLECADDIECAWPRCSCPPAERRSIRLQRAYGERVMEKQKGKQ